MTSWVKRIGNVKAVVESVMNNSMKPDRLYLNLSKIEFDGIDLPENLVEYFNSDDSLIINWVDGENTKSMKKVFPILEYLDDDDIIINIDDDALLPKDFIENRYNDFKIKKSPITSCNNPRYHFIDKSLEIWSCGAGSLFQKKMLNGYEKFMDSTLIHTYHDDRCYSALLWLNGYKFTPCSSYFMQNGAIDSNGTKLKRYNDIEPMGKNHVYVNGEAMYNILEKRIKNLFGVGFKGSFGILNKNVEFKESESNISTSSNNNIVQKIREGIKNGTIIKEMRPDGTYIWKKIRK